MNEQLLDQMASSLASVCRALAQVLETLPRIEAQVAALRGELSAAAWHAARQEGDSE